MTQRHMTLAALLSLIAAPALAEGNAIKAGMGWSSLHGTIASLGFEATDIKGSGLDLSAALRRGDTGNGGNLRLRYSADLGATAIGQNTQAQFSVNGAASDWADQAFSSTTTRTTAGLAAQSAFGLTYSGQVFWQTDNHYDAKVAASPLVTSELGRSTAGGFILGLGIDHLDNPQLPSSGYAIDGSVTVATLGDRNFTAYDLRATVAQPIWAGGAVVVHGETGMIQGRSGQTVSIHDRAFMGGTAPRGFAIGGAGPRDYDPANSIDSPLGGNRYVFGSIEARHTVSDNLTLALFSDVGASWELDGTPVGSMGAIDDGLHLRNSVGVSAYWTTGIGTVRLNLATATQKQDYDQLNPVSLELVSSF